MEHDDFLSTAEAAALLAHLRPPPTREDLRELAKRGAIPGACKNQRGEWQLPRAAVMQLEHDRQPPRSWLRRHWKTLGVGGLCGVVGVILALPAFIRESRDAIVGQNFANQVHVSVDAGAAPKTIEDQLDAAGLPVFQYETSVSDGTATLKPLGDYGSVIQQIAGEPFSFQLPVLDMKLTNNSAETKFIDEVIVKVSTSQVDLRPVPVLSCWNAGKFDIEEWGWGEILSGSIEVTSKLTGRSATYPLPKPNRGGSFGSQAFQFDCAPLVAANGGDALLYSRLISDDAMRGDFEENNRGNQAAWQRALGSEMMQTMPDGSRRLVSDLEVDVKLRCVKRLTSGQPEPFEITFPAWINLTASGGGAGDGGVDGRADLFFKESGHGYELRAPLSVAFKSKDVARVQLRCGAPKSSFHHLEVFFGCTDGTVVRGPRVYLEVFFPRVLALDFKERAATGG